MAKPWMIRGLNPHAPLRQSAEKILHTRYREMMSYAEGTLRGSDIEDLHNMRVSARRLQAAMRLFRDCFPKSVFRRESSKLQELIRALGTVRETDVLASMAKQFVDQQPPEQKPAIQLFLAQLHVRRMGEHRSLRVILRKTLTGHRTRKFTDFLKAGR